MLTFYYMKYIVQKFSEENFAQEQIYGKLQYIQFDTN